MSTRGQEITLSFREMSPEQRRQLANIPGAYEAAIHAGDKAKDFGVNITLAPEPKNAPPPNPNGPPVDQGPGLFAVMGETMVAGHEIHAGLNAEFHGNTPAPQGPSPGIKSRAGLKALQWDNELNAKLEHKPEQQLALAAPQPKIEQKPQWAMIGDAPRGPGMQA